MLQALVDIASLAHLINDSCVVRTKRNLMASYLKNGLNASSSLIARGFKLKCRVLSTETDTGDRVEHDLLQKLKMRVDLRREGFLNGEVNIDVARP